MRCNRCDYPLWNLTARACPECGTPFRPGDYQFVPHSVAFCCPECGQTYYGTGARGHLEPAQFSCVSCRRALTMDEMILRPAAGVEEVATRADHMPWLERRERGLLRSYFATIGMSMVSPHRLMNGVPLDTPVWDAWLFAAITWLLILACGVVLPFMVIAVVVLASGDTSEAAEMAAVAAGSLVVGGVVLLGRLLLWGLTAHAVLRLSGGAGASLGRTIQALCYSSGTNVITAVPCLGPYCGQWIGAVWHVVSAVFMVMTGQKVSGVRATVSTLVWPVIEVALTVATYFGLMVFGMMAGQGGPFQVSIMTRAEVANVTAGLVAHAAGHEGRWPDHAARLVTDGTLGAENFVMELSDTVMEGVPLGETDLETLEFMPPNKARAVVAQAAEALGPDVVAHRVGDFVFTYHGIEYEGAEPALWIVIMSPDPDAGPHPDVEPKTAVGRVDGSVLVFDPEEFTAALEEQNGLRAAAGLPPLPDPGTVTHAAPPRRQ